MRKRKKTAKKKSPAPRKRDAGSPPAPGAGVVADLLTAAASPDAKVRRTAAAAIAGERRRERLLELRALLFDADPVVSRATVRAFLDGDPSPWSWPEAARAEFQARLAALVAAWAGREGPASPAGQAFAAADLSRDLDASLRVAAAAGETDWVLLLRKFGRTLTTSDGTGGTALSYCLERATADAALVRAVTSPADLHRRNERGETPLHVAARRGHAEAVAVLLEAGADRETRDARGDTAEQLARAAGAPAELVQRLRPDEPRRPGPRWGRLLMDALAAQMPPITGDELARATERQRVFAQGLGKGAWAPVRCEGGLHFANVTGRGSAPAGLVYTRFAGTDVRRLALPWADLTGSHGRDQDFSGACLIGARVMDADFIGASFRGAQLARVDGSRSRFSRCDLREADLTEADLERADLTHADLRGAILRRAHLRDCDLRHADLSGADLQRIDATGADLRGAVLDARALARLEGALREGDPTVARPNGPRTPSAAARHEPGAPAEAALHLLVGAISGEEILPLAPLLRRMLGVPAAAPRAAAALAALGLHGPRFHKTVSECLREPSPATPEWLDRVAAWLEARTLRLPDLEWRWPGGAAGTGTLRIFGDRLTWQIGDAAGERGVHEGLGGEAGSPALPEWVRLGVARFVRPPVTAALARERFLGALPQGQAEPAGRNCPTCGTLGAAEHAKGHTGQSLPSAADRLVTLAEAGREELRRCPECGALFHWQNDYEFMGWDDYSLRRIDGDEARRMVEGGGMVFRA